MSRTLPIEWAQLSAVDETVIAASPMIQGRSEVPHRIVIRPRGQTYFQCYWATRSASEHSRNI
jgi:hypothetical protein